MSHSFEIFLISNHFMRTVVRIPDKPEEHVEFIKINSFGKKTSTDSVVSGVISEENDKLALTSGTKIVTYDLRTCEKVKTEKRLHLDVISGILWAPNNTKITVSFDCHVKLSSENSVIADTKLPNWLNTLDLVDNKLWVGDLNGSITLLDYPSLSISEKLDGCHLVQNITSSVNSISHSAKGIVASTGADGNFLLWDPKTLSVIRREIATHSGSKMNGIIFHPSKDAFVSSGRDSSLLVWDLRMDKPIKRLRSESHVNNVFRTNMAWESNDIIITGSENGKLIAYSLTQGKPIAETTVSQTPVHSVFIAKSESKRIYSQSIRSMETSIFELGLPYQDEVLCNEMENDIELSGNEDRLIGMLQRQGMSLSAFDLLQNLIASNADNVGIEE